MEAKSALPQGSPRALAAACEVEFAWGLPEAEVAALWQGLEAHAAGASFFQSWAWIGCRYRARFGRAVLAVVRHGDAVVALGLLGLGSDGRLHLNETGHAGEDTVFVEHNGLLVRAAYPAADLLRLVVEFAATEPLLAGRRWVLGGLDAPLGEELRDALEPTRIVRRTSFVRHLDAGEDPLAQLSANTRQQARRSLRWYERFYGDVTLERAETPLERRAALNALAALHETTWRARGHPGAFAQPCFRAFHEALIEREIGRARIDLLTMRAGGQIFGVLYNLRLGDQIASYQSGFDYGPGHADCRPGIVAHLQAMSFYARESCSYDMLAGEARYKRSLAAPGPDLVWIETLPSPLMRGLEHLARLRTRIGRFLA